MVVCGRRTAWSDYLLGYARARRIAARVDFIYELTPSDLPALFRLARVFAYLPDADAEASVVPVVEALRAGLPMVLSDTQVNREAAGGSAGTNRLSGHFLRIPNPKLLPKKVLRILAVLKDSSIFVFAK